MQSTVATETTRPVDALNEDVRRAGMLSGRRAKAWRHRLVNLVLIFSDVLLALLVGGAAFVLQSAWGSGPLSAITVAIVVPSVAAWVGLCALLGLYPGYGLNQAEELRRQTHAVLATLAITTAFAFALQVGQMMSRLVLALVFLGLLLFAPLTRQLVKGAMTKAGLWGKPVVIFSVGELGEHVATLLNRERRLGYKPVAVFGDQTNSTKMKFEETSDEKTLADAMYLSRKHRVDTIILAIPHTHREHLAKLANWASFGFQHVMILPDLEGVTNSAVVPRDFAGILGVEIQHNLLNPSILRMKRALDLVSTLVGGILILPLILALCLLVWLESRGAVFYSAQRMGRDGTLFSCWKFRTMVPDAEAALQRTLEENPELREEYSKYHKLREDPRVTRVGRFLRKTSLDELPQLWNVLRGEMSLVGPRPYLPRESDKIGAAKGEILRVYPGITGPWQVSGRSNTHFDDRVRIDAYYVRNWSIWLDLVLLARTAKALVVDRGAC